MNGRNHRQLWDDIFNFVPKLRVNHRSDFQPLMYSGGSFRFPQP